MFLFLKTVIHNVDMHGFVFCTVHGHCLFVSQQAHSFIHNTFTKKYSKHDLLNYDHVLLFMKTHRKYVLLKCDNLHINCSETAKKTEQLHVFLKCIPQQIFTNDFGNLKILSS